MATAAAGRLADLFGRRALLIAAAVCFIVSAWGSGIAATSGEFVFYRIIGGLAVGMQSTAITMILIALAVVIGIVLLQIVDDGTGRVTGVVTGSNAVELRYCP